MNQRKSKPDIWLSLAVFALIVFGLIMIYSVSKYYSLQITNEKTDKFFLVKQLKWLFIGVITWIVFQSIDYSYWEKKSKTMFYLTLILLFLPILPFAHGGGAGERWVDLKIIQFQPSEVAKLTLILYLAAWFASKKDDLNKIKNMSLSFFVFVGMIALLLLVQKDLGTLAVFTIISAIVFMIAGAPIQYLFAGGGLAALLLWLSIKIEPYRMQRFLTFLNPENDNLGNSYHIRNALIAIGSGGLFGLGFGQSKQKYLYLPEAHTDSIFAISAEELGFVRVILIVLVFGFIILRGYKIARNAPDTFSRLVASGITTWIFVQMFVNIAAMLSLLPLTGIPLPFISYGGSSLLILLAGIGILINISKSQRNNIVIKK